MKYVCICMSPAVDACTALDRAPKGEGEIFKNVETVENVGGKTINVARWLAIRLEQTGRKTPVLCRGLLGADNATPFEREFAKYGVLDAMTRVPGLTRRNEMITWPGGAVKLNQAAFPAVELDCDRWLAESIAECDEGDVVILSGSLPRCCGADFYAKAVAAFKTRGAFVVLDASGEPMRLALASHPDLVKPNAEECETLVGFVPRTREDFMRATAMLRGEIENPVAQGRAGHVIVSDGGAGAWFDGVFEPAPKVEVVDTTAAGDTLLAEYCFSHNSRLAVAAGSAACTMPGSTPPIGVLGAGFEVLGGVTPSGR